MRTGLIRTIIRGAGVAVGLALTSAVLAASVAFAAPPPSADPFYTYSGSLTNIAPGTVLKTRQVTLEPAGAAPALSATQVLYRTSDQLGDPSATVATIIRPPVSTGGTKLLSYQTAYDGVSDTCRPSYQLVGGQPDNSIVTAETPLILSYVTQGFTVVTSDYEGPTDDYGAGREEGYNTLDAIRAAEHELGLSDGTTPVGLLGYSGGSIATMWAAQEQPSYAPGLDINGVAAGGIPVDFTHNLQYISGSSDWAGAIPSVGIGLMRAYKLNLPTYLSAEGEQIASQVEQGCLNPSAYPGLTLSDLLKPQYKDWQKVPVFARIFNDSIMGQGETPRGPLLMGVGNADGTGDGVMVAKDVQELAYEYCQRGDNVQFNVYSGMDHVEALAPFEVQALAFLQQVYNGQTPASGCSSITPGNGLTPLPVPVQASSSRLKLRVVGVSKRLHGLVIRLSTTSGTVDEVTLKLRRGGKLDTKVVVARVTTHARRVVLRIDGRAPHAGRYRLIALVGGSTALRRSLRIRARA